MATIDIFYKSFHRDYKLLYLSLKSLTLNVSGYDNVIILIPETEKELFDTRDLPERTLVYYVPEYGNGYLFQQWCKISAHKFSYADYILFSDSDCIFDHPINLQEFVADEKPEILYTDWKKVGDAICWKQPTETLMRERVPFEFMRRNCLIYHRSTLENIERFEPNLESMIMNSVRFSEFNSIGAYAYKFEREKYNFINTDDWEYTRPKAEQLWSNCDKDSGGVHTQEYKRMVDVIKKVLGIDYERI